MPDLGALILRSSPHVQPRGRLIKGLYYSDSLNGPYTLAAFFIACDRLREPKPFLVMDFRSSQFSFDRNRDGYADATGLMLLPEIDPADFYPAVDGAEEICDEDAISQRQLNGLVATLNSLPRKRLSWLSSLYRPATMPPRSVALGPALGAPLFARGAFSCEDKNPKRIGRGQL
jgi:hypothetical protein